MSITPQKSLLAVARLFIRKSTGVAAITAIVPLALVVMSNTAKGGTQSPVAFSVSSYTDNTTGANDGITGPFGNYSANGATTNNIQAETFGSNLGISVAGSTEDSFTDALIFSGTIVNKISNIVEPNLNLYIQANTIMPVGYDFTLSESGALATSPTEVDWTLYLNFAGNSNTTIGSGKLIGTSASNFYGNANYTFSALTYTSTTYTAELVTSFTPLSAGTVNIGMSEGTGQGVILNGVAVPEPSTYALLFAAAAGMLVVYRRRRR